MAMTDSLGKPPPDQAGSDPPATIEMVARLTEAGVFTPAAGKAAERLLRLYFWNHGRQHLLFQQIVLAATGAWLVGCLSLAGPGRTMVLLAHTLDINLLLLAAIIVAEMETWSTLVPAGILLGLTALAAAFFQGEPLAAGEVLLRDRRRSGGCRVGPPSFFFQESRYGEFRVTPGGDALLVGRRGQNLETLQPPASGTGF